MRTLGALLLLVPATGVAQDEPTDTAQESEPEPAPDAGPASSPEPAPPASEAPRASAEPSPVPPPLAPPPELHLHGFVGFDWMPYLKPMAGAVDSVVQLRVAPRIEGRFRAIRGAAEIELRKDFVDAARDRLLLREAKAGLLVRGLRVEAGALRPRWGRMDVASPEDNVVAWDYEDLFFPEALPVPGVLLGFARDFVSVEGLLLPAFAPSRYRTASPSRWDITRFLPQTQSVPGPLGDPLEFANDYASFVAPVLDGDAFHRGIEAGARVDFTLPNFDVGASFLATRDRLPTYTAFRTTNNGDEDGDGLPDHFSSRVAQLEVTPHHRRVWVPGLDLEGVLGPFVLKGEAAFFATEDPSHASCLIDDPYVRYALGAELMLRNLVGDFGLAIRAQYNGDVTLPAGSRPGPDRFDASLFFPNGEDHGNHDRGCQAIPYAGDAPVATDYETGYQASPEQRHPYSHAWYWNATFDFTPSVQLDVRGFVDVAGDALLIVRATGRVLDRVELSAGAMVVLATGEDTIFTPYADNHRLELAAAWRF